MARRRRSTPSARPRAASAASSSAPAADAAAPTTTQSAWMHPVVRAWLVSLRPWSFPASLGPVALAGAVLHRPPAAAAAPLPLLTLEYVLCFVVVLSFHAAANLFNTYYDFRSGADTKAAADDRGLVDGTVSPATVFRSACACLAAGAGAAAFLAAHIGPALLVVVVPAAALCFFYTADPFSLKRYALGDLTIFLMFGPLLMTGVNLAVAGPAAAAHGPAVLCYSVPVGLLTVAILHANNARDVAADRAAGITTLAMKLGDAHALRFHCALFAAAYGSVAALVVFGVPPSSAATSSSSTAAATAAASSGANDVWTLGTTVLPPAVSAAFAGAATTPRQLLVFLCVPWALYVTRCFRAGVMGQLPQRIAQHNLVFCTLLVMGLSEPMFLARVLIGCLFYLGGVNNIIMWSYNIHMVVMKLGNVWGAPIPRSLAQFLFASAAVFQLVVSVLFMLGVQPLLMAQLLLVWIVPVTFAVHDMWTIEHDCPAHVVPKGVPPYPSFAQRTVAIFPTEFDNEFVHFFKNVQIIGGLCLYCEVFGA
jgi:1,4-dihydroxy-2-naphthoate polyprenyltransferase